MKLSPVSPILLASLTLIAGCSKSAPSDTKTTGASAPSPAAACGDNLAKLMTTAPPDAKKAFPSICASVSAPTQSCIAKAKVDKDVDACLATNKADKDAFMIGMMGAALASTPATPPAGPTRLAKLGLQLDVPGEAMVSDGLTAKSQMVNASSIGGLVIGAVTGTTPKTLKAAKAEAQVFKPLNVKGDESGGTYWMTFENKGSLGTNYWVKTLQKVGKQTYVCEGSPDTADKEAAALAACRSLRAL